MATCSRSGCTKILRRDNSTGMCSSNCQSPEAPPSQRARNSRAAASKKADDILDYTPGTKKPAADSSELREKFATVAAALGFDPEQLLDEARQEWLNAAGEVIRKANAS